MTILLPKKLATAYEMQIGKHCFRWCFLKGGAWKHWWQIDRFKYRKETP